MPSDPAATQADPDQRLDNRKPPEDHGRKLVTFPHGKDGKEEIRISVTEFGGKRRLQFMIWKKDCCTGIWWPQKGRGFALSPTNVALLTEAIVGVEGEFPAERAGASRPSQEVPKARRYPVQPQLRHGPWPANPAGPDKTA